MESNCFEILKQSFNKMLGEICKTGVPFWNTHFFCDVTISKSGKKGPKLYPLYRG